MLSHTWWISYLEYVILHNLLTCAIDIFHDNLYSIVFTPDITLKDELANTAIQITCYNRDGEEVKRVTSTDPGTVEDPEQENQGGEDPSTGSGTEGQGGGSSQGGNEGGGGANPDDDESGKN